MRTYILLIGLILLISTSTAASEPFGKLAPYWRTPTPYYVENPKVIPPKTFAPPRTSQYGRTKTVGPHAYPYGYFGVQTRPYSYRSFGYYENSDQSTYGWGY
jgi:hypothetical protein